MSKLSTLTNMLYHDWQNNHAWIVTCISDDGNRVQITRTGEHLISCSFDISGAYEPNYAEPDSEPLRMSVPANSLDWNDNVWIHALNNLSI